MRSFPHHRAGLLIACAAVLFAGGCHRAKMGSIDVTVIGERPTLADPATGPLTAADALLLENAAQGLVRFDPRGQIEAGLAERWNVSDDGLSYIFRLQSGKWPSGRKIDARDVARLLNRARRESSLDVLKDTLGAIDEIVAMTDRVIEIRLSAPRPHLLQLLAQPDFAILRDGEGTGPFTLLPTNAAEPLHLRRLMPGADGDAEVHADIRLIGLPVPSAVANFVAGKSDLLLGGTFSDLAVALHAGPPRGALRFDPVAGLFALVPGRQGGPLADRALRSLVARAIDRDAFVAALKVDGLAPRYTLLQPGLDGVTTLPAPPWTTIPLARRAPQLVAEANRLWGRRPRPALTISLPAGPGSTLLFHRLADDLARIGLTLRPAAAGEPVDLRLLDEVAPSTSPAWFVRRLRCDRVPICDAQVDDLADAARATQSADQRAQFLLAAAQRVDSEYLLIPLTAPIRWSLVGGDAPGFSENRFARHTFIDLGRKTASER